MKIGILTHPQGANYGGILQCYALCTYLRKLGHDPIVIQRIADKSFFLWEWTRALLRKLHFPRYYTSNMVDRTVNILPFISKHLVRTEPIDSQFKMRTVCQKYGLKAVIVGSDQVWRHSYATRFGNNYFLDFVPDNVLKLSYAASFGLSDWQYTAEETNKIIKLLSRFVGISVREEEAVSLLKNNIGCDAIQLIDPTMLLTRTDYEMITSARIVDERYIFVYWLGNKSDVENEIKSYKDKGYKVVDVNLRDLEEQISVEDWLSYIKYADYVITDSFHGCVFSILFERKFEALKNDSGGNGRISSLLNMLGIVNTSNVDYLQVKSILDKQRKSASTYLLDKLQ